MVFDDRLDGADAPDDQDELMDVAEAIAEELAEQHYGECYGEGVCGACITDTPLSLEWGPWMGKAQTFDALIEAAEDRMDALGEDSHWVRRHLTGRYFDHFHAQAVDPEDCAVCTGEIVGDDGCGHVMAGRTCPVGD